MDGRARETRLRDEIVRPADASADEREDLDTLRIGERPAERVETLLAPAVRGRRGTR